jgi:acyl-CoA synthetase (AMP-forming)/AMP-acid ligase II
VEQSFFLTRMLESLRHGGERTAFIHNGTEITFGQALTSLRQLHAALAAEGVSAGEVVAVVAGNRPETILVQLAAQLRSAAPRCCLSPRRRVCRTGWPCSRPRAPGR